MKTAGERTIFRLVGIWDLALTLPFALPVVNGYMVGVLKSVHVWLSPERAFPEFGALHLFFVQLFGILAVLWAVVRIHRPSRFLAAYDAGGRVVVAACMISFTLLGGSAVPALFSISEIGFAVVQGLVLLQRHKAP